jgi:hypothetical protein
MPVRNPYLFALLAVGIAAYAHADSITTIDVTGVFSNVPDGTSINGQAISDGTTSSSGTTFDARFYFDPSDVSPATYVSPPETTYADPNHGDSLVISNGTTSDTVVANSKGAELGIVFLGPLDSVFLVNSAIGYSSPGSMGADFFLPSTAQADTSFDSTVNALATVAPGSFSVFTDQGYSISGSDIAVTVNTAAPVPLPPAAEAVMVLLGGYGIVAALRNRGRLSRVLRPA